MPMPRLFSCAMAGMAAQRIREDNASPFFIRFLNFDTLLCLMIYDEYLFFSLTKLVFFINKQGENGVMWCFYA
jgi:hypothetical protein